MRDVESLWRLNYVTKIRHGDPAVNKDKSLIK